MMLHEAYAEPAANPERSKGNAFRVHDVLQSDEKNTSRWELTCGYIAMA